MFLSKTSTVYVSVIFFVLFQRNGPFVLDQNHCQGYNKYKEVIILLTVIVASFYYENMRGLAL